MKNLKTQENEPIKPIPLMGGVLNTVSGGVRAPTTTFPTTTVGPHGSSGATKGVPDGMDG